MPRIDHALAPAAPSAQVPYISNRWFEPDGVNNGNGSGTPNEGRLIAESIWLPSNAISNLGSFVVTGGAAGAVIRFGIYDDVNGVPTNLLLDAGTAAATANSTLVSVAASLTPSTAGWYWFVSAVQGAAASRPAVVVRASSTTRPNIYASGTSPNGFGQGGWYRDSVTGALPSPFAPAGNIGISSVPVVYGKWA